MGGLLLLLLLPGDLVVVLPLPLLWPLPPRVAGVGGWFFTCRLGEVLGRLAGLVVVASALELGLFGPGLGLGLVPDLVPGLNETLVEAFPLVALEVLFFVGFLAALEGWLLNRTAS